MALGDVKDFSQSRCFQAFTIRTKVIKDFNVPKEREHNQVKMLTYFEARDLVKKLAFKSPEEFWAWTRSPAKSKAFPRDPDKFYFSEWNVHGGILNFLDLAKKDIYTMAEDLLGPMETGYMYYEGAESYIQGVKFKGERIFTKLQLIEWLQSEERPESFPPNPWKTYYQNGWIDLVTFLGSNKEYKYMSYEEAEVFIRQVEFKGQFIETETQMDVWIRESGERPKIFPTDPRYTYANKGWKNIKAFLGTEYMSYEEAEVFIRQVEFKGQSIETETQMDVWIRESGERPKIFPFNPKRFYTNKGWTNMKAFLGTEYMSYEEAEVFIRQVKFKEQPIETERQMYEWIRESGERLRNFPADPRGFYANKGWINMRAFLGTEYMSYEEAEVFIRQVKFKEQSIETEGEMYKWIRESGERPRKFPADPGNFYANKGWTNIKAFLGTEYMSYKKARAFIQQVKFKRQPIETEAQMDEWIRESGERPKNFPSKPRKIYANKGWANIKAFLGTEYMSYEEAEVFIRQVKFNEQLIETETQMDKWIRESGERPKNFPFNPRSFYANKGWINIQHFLSREVIQKKDKSDSLYEGDIIIDSSWSKKESTKSVPIVIPEFGFQEKMIGIQ